MSVNSVSTRAVLTVADIDLQALEEMLACFGISVETVAADRPIPGSFWGGTEAGLRGNRLLLRADTPVHSALHEACHYICMPDDRRNWLDTDAGGDYDEENAVCYLQILLAQRLANVGGPALMEDMDAWGYSFRLGSAAAWFERDADDARAWLSAFGLVDAQGNPTSKLRHHERP